MNPLLLTDGYKLSHREQYPAGTTKVYSNWTPRKSRIKHADSVVNFGLQYVIGTLVKDFKEHFFDIDKEEVCSEYKRIVEEYLGSSYDISHIEELHDLQYLPLEIKQLPEGNLVPMRVPTMTITNTHPNFFWLVNYLETLISCMLWQPMTSATLSFHYRNLFEKWAKVTGSKSDIIPGVLNNIDIQGHDFSMRGMGGSGSAILSGIGHAASFKGSDTLPVMKAMKQYYNSGRDLVICSVPATEHSVMCAGSKDGEFETFKRLITETYPTGIVSIVSDTWDLWTVLTDYLPKLKDEIMARDGKVVIRPDSGDPVDIICGNSHAEYEPIKKGVVELLWDTFGGTTNHSGYKELDPHIGCIYGDAITLDRANEICLRLSKKGFASTNWVAGIGSFTYQYNTRDTFGFAMKATHVEVNGQGREIFKDPITDDGTKKSAKGLMYVQKNDINGSYELIDMVTSDEEKGGELKTLFINNEFQNRSSLSEIRERLMSNIK
jgi:nicotinamide phosphoribosyltransferase